MEGMRKIIDKSTLFFLFFSIIATIVLFFPIFFLVFTTPPDGYFKAISDKEVIRAIMLSILTASLTTIFAIIIGVPFAYFLARYQFRGRDFIDSLIDIPILLPHSVAGIVLLSTFGPNQLLGKGLEIIGISIVDSIFGIVLAQFFVSAPLLIKTTKAVFESIGEDYIKAARVFGARRIRAFLEIELPMAQRGILAGAVLCWARAVSEFGAVIILTYYPYTAPVLIFIKFTTEGLKASKPISALLVLITLAIFLAIKKLGGVRYA